MTVYLDTSVVVALIVDEPSSEAARAWFRRADDDFIMADLAAVEFAAHKREPRCRSPIKTWLSEKVGVSIAFVPLAFLRSIQKCDIGHR